jgi:hypothetical protein
MGHPLVLGLDRVKKSQAALALYCAFTFTQADGDETRPFTITAKGHLVAVFEKSALLARGQSDWLPAIARDLEQTAASLIFGPGDSAAAQQITRSKVAAVACVMGQQLGRGPVEMTQVAAAETNRLAHAESAKINLERQIDAALLPVSLGVEIGKRRWILG